MWKKDAYLSNHKFMGEVSSPPVFFIFPFAIQFLVSALKTVEFVWPTRSLSGGMTTTRPFILCQRKLVALTQTKKLNLIQVSLNFIIFILLCNQWKLCFLIDIVVISLYLISYFYIFLVIIFYLFIYLFVFYF